MTLMPMWRSTIFGPYFVVGANLLGHRGALLVAMVMIRKYFNLQNYLLPVHFDNLAKMLLTMSLLWFYFTFTEYLVTWYGNEAPEMPVFWSKISAGSRRSSGSWSPASSSRFLFCDRNCGRYRSSSLRRAAFWWGCGSNGS